jgi:hypothetical protein
MISNLPPQNFSIPAGYNEVVTFNVDPAVTPTLVDATVLWKVYEQNFGIPFGLPILEKAAPDITSIDSPLSFEVQMMTADTIALPPLNYYHEATILNAANEIIGGSWGIMTVTETEYRP